MYMLALEIGYPMISLAKVSVSYRFLSAAAYCLRLLTYGVTYNHRKIIKLLLPQILPHNVFISRATDVSFMITDNRETKGIVGG